MQISLRAPRLALILALGLYGLAACSRTSEPVSDAPTLPTKAEILDQYETAMLQAEATEGAGAPAMWTLADADTQIYLFGTVHMLRPELQWRTPTMRAAFESADTIVFEVDMKSEAAQKKIMSDFVARGMYDDGRTLSAVLDGAVEAEISAAFESIGVPYAAVDVMEPWMASVNLGAMKLTMEGYDPNSGVESVLESEAKAADKSFAFLEEISDQADAFDLLPEHDQIVMLYSTALTLDEGTSMLDRLVDEWADGDTAGLTALVASPESAGLSDAVYEALLVKRNAKWVPQIETMLDTPGTVFIAVGAAHLVGPDSVVAMLRDKGYQLEGP